MRAWLVRAACVAALAVGCGRSGEGGRGGAPLGGVCTPGATTECTARDGRPGTQTCGADGGGWRECVSPACGAIPVRARGTLYTSARTVPLAGAETAAALETVPADGGGACLAHGTLSAEAGGCRLEVELGAGLGAYGGVRAVVLTVGPGAPGFTAAQEGRYLSPPGWAPGLWSPAQASFDAGVACVPIQVGFRDEIVRLTRADGAQLDVDLRDVAFVGDLTLAPRASPVLGCLTLACGPGRWDGGAGFCAPEGTCARGYHDGGRRACVLEGTCARGYTVATDGACIAWERAGELLRARSGAVAFRLPDGDVLVTGGHTASPNPQDPVPSERYRPSLRAWSDTGMPHSTHDSGAYAQLPDGRILATGGYLASWYGSVSSGPTNAAEIYDPRTGSWTSVAPMMSRRYDHVAVTLADGHVLVTGGQDGSPMALADAETYDPVADRWDPAGRGRERSSHGAARLPDGRVLVAGGSWMPEAEIWDPQTRSFALVGGTATGASWDYPRTRPRFTPIPDGRLLVTFDDGSVELLEPRTMERKRLTQFPNEYRIPVAPLGGSVVVAVGEREVRLLDLDAQTVTTVDGAPRGHSGGTVTPLPDGTVLVAGGGSTKLATDVFVGVR